MLTRLCMWRKIYNSYHTIAETNKNHYSAEFVVNSNKHWKESILSFRGRHAQWFYKDLKFQKLDWSIFDFEDTNLGRVDLCYDRKLKASDKDLNLFFENSSRRINSKKDNRSAKSDSNILLSSLQFLVLFKNNIIK